ncbi:hypothetical protein AMTRI_Chr09g19310 [Amborella trichopoda]
MASEEQRVRLLGTYGSPFVHRKVPVLIHGEKTICESVVILEYIEETWPKNPSLSKDPYERAQAGFWSEFCFTCWTAYSKQGAQQAKALEEFQEGLKTLRGGLKGKFFGGENIGFLDIVANFLGVWMGAQGEAANIEHYDAEKTPLIHSWIQQMSSIQIVKDSLPSRDMLVALFKGYCETLLFLCLNNVGPWLHFL